MSAEHWKCPDCGIWVPALLEHRCPPPFKQRITATGNLGSSTDPHQLVALQCPFCTDTFLDNYPAQVHLRKKHRREII